jgi:SAM-dependent methyltransferase
MKVHQDECLSDVSRYIASKKNLRLEDHELEYRNTLRLIKRFVNLTPDIKMLEIGTGTGWFPLSCQREGIYCKGLEISPQLIAYARDLGRQYGLEANIDLGNIEETDVGDAAYDVIIANSVFEHIQYWRKALERVYRALRPGGMLFFASTNKFSFVSNEYDMLFYGWMPDRMRYRFRVARHGDDIMKLGIDFNQFTYPGLRRALREIGFSRIYDRIEVADPERSGSLKKRGLQLAKSIPIVKQTILTFCDATLFVCIK